MNEPQFIHSSAPHVVEMAEGSHDARSKTTHQTTEVQHTVNDTAELVLSNPAPERKPDSFSPSGTKPSSASTVIFPPDVSAGPRPDHSLPPSVLAAEAFNLPAHKQTPAPHEHHAQSDFSERLNHLKNENNHIRAELKRRESSTPNKD